MLDECKGEKFEEALVTFSTIVLKRKVKRESMGAGSVVRGLVLAHSMPASQQESLLPLAIAHRASLAAQLRKKKELRSQYSSFGRLLDLKEQGLADRARRLMEASQSQSEDHVPENTAEECKQHLKNHWLADTKWVDTIVQGNPHSKDDSLLDTPFNRVWSDVQNGTSANVKDTRGRTLLAELEIRVTGQQDRLGRWKRFQDDMKKNAASRDGPLKAHSSPKQEKGLGLEFRRHQDLVPKLKHSQGAQSTQEATRNLPMTVITSEYQKLITSMREELANVGKPKTRRDTSWREESRRGTLAPKHGVDVEEISTLSESVSEPHSPHSKDHVLPEEKLSISVLSENVTMPRTVHHQTTNVNESEAFDTPPRTYDFPPVQEPSSLPPQNKCSTELEIESTSISEAQSSVSALELPRMPYPNDQPSSQKDEDDSLAEQILASVANAEPSPVKPKLSLAERTRRSMAYHNKDSPSMGPPPMPPSQPPMPESPVLPSPDSETLNSRASLLERTRQSMSLLPTKPRKSMHKPRPSKLFPTNQFATPKKQHTGMTNDVRSLTPPEEVFSQEADYASVFKSRPKIGLSPTLSPTRLEEVPSEVEDMELTGNWVSSPVVRAVGRIGGV